MDDEIALITGITGQDGPYLAEFLLARGYIVHGTTRRSPAAGGPRIDRLRRDLGADSGRLAIHSCDVADADQVTTLLHLTRPTEIYNLAAQSNVQESFDAPRETGEINAFGALRLLEAVRSLDFAGRTRYYQASTSELFGNAPAAFQSETTPFHPRSPYAAAKLYAYWLTVTYRETMGVHASNGILFNHESPYRPEAFVTRKIARAAAAASLGLGGRLAIGNLDAERDWGHARDYVEGMWLMLQQAEPDDYVLATGETHSVRDFIEAAYACAGRAIDWRGSATEETAVDARTGEVLVEIDPRYFRKAEIHTRRGDPGKARDRLGWRHRTSFSELVREMVAHDVTALRLEAEFVEQTE